MTTMNLPIEYGAGTASINVDPDGRVVGIVEHYHDEAFLTLYHKILAELDVSTRELRRLLAGELPVSRQAWLERQLSVAVRRTHARLADARRRAREQRGAQAASEVSP